MFVGMQIKSNMTKTDKWDTAPLEYSLIFCNLVVSIYALYYIIVPIILLKKRKYEAKLADRKKRKSNTKTMPFSKDQVVAEFTHTNTKIGAIMPLDSNNEEGDDEKTNEMLIDLQNIRKKYGAGSEEYQKALASLK